MDTGTLGDLYDFEVRYVDSEGVRWQGQSTQRIKRDMSFGVGLAPYVPALEDLPDEIVKKLEGTEGGAGVIQAIRELQTAVKSGMILAVVALGSHVIEGLIKAKCRIESVWSDDLESKPLGALLSDSRVRKVIPAGWVDKLEGLNKLRRSAVHPKGALGQQEEASLTTGLVRGLATDLFGS